LQPLMFKFVHVSHHHRLTLCIVAEGSSQRMVNPRAWNRGTVFLQCQNCQVWHNVVDNLKLVDEIRFVDGEQ
jgi:hypothetical protein